MRLAFARSRSIMTVPQTETARPRGADTRRGSLILSDIVLEKGRAGIRAVSISGGDVVFLFQPIEWTMRAGGGSVSIDPVHVAQTSGQLVSVGSAGIVQG